MFVRQETVINKLKVFYWEWEPKGDEKNRFLVLLPGWLAEPKIYFDIFQKDKNSFCNFQRIIILDWPGFGRSAPPFRPWNIADFGLFLNSFFEKIKIISEKTTLVGHSFGGAVASLVVAENTIVPQKLILISPSIVRKKTFWQKWKMFFLLFFSKFLKLFLWFLPYKLRKRTSKQFSRLLGSDDYLTEGVMKETFRKIIKEDLSEKIRDISISVFLIWGKLDKSVPLRQAKIVQNSIPNSRLDVISNAGHFPFLDSPIEFRHVFQKALKSN